MSPVITVLRLCFIVMFAAMSLMHGPIMMFSGAHAAGTAAHQLGPADAAESNCHEDKQPSAKHPECNAFACFVAVEPLPVMGRALVPLLFAVMAAAPMRALQPLRTAPALPPPRLQG